MKVSKILIIFNVKCPNVHFLAVAVSRKNKQSILLFLLNESNNINEKLYFFNVWNDY